MIGLTTLLPNDDPTGIKIIEISGWNGKAFVIPRGKLGEIKERAEANSPAVYFLFGEGDVSSKQKVYIGESETFLNRLSNHDGNKDFWNSAIVFTGAMNRAHVKYLENKSIALAKKIGRHEIENKIEPLENKLSEFDRAAADAFFEKMKLILAVSGFSLFREVPKKISTTNRYYFNTKDVLANGTLLDDGEFIVFEGSAACLQETNSFAGSGGSGLRKRLEIEGVLTRTKSDTFLFAKDYIFNSPSAAGDTVAGRSVNGWTAWKDADGRTLDENVRK